MAGGRAVVWLTECARDVLDAFGVAAPEVCAAPVCPPPPHAASMVSAASAAGPASALSSAERSAGRIVMPPWGTQRPAGMGAGGQRLMVTGQLVYGKPPKHNRCNKS